jgi:hypothetical protein
MVIAIPSLSVLSDSRIKSDARRLVSIVRYLNDNAVSLKEVYVLQIDFDNSGRIKHVFQSNRKRRGLQDNA